MLRSASVYSLCIILLLAIIPGTEPLRSRPNPSTAITDNSVSTTITHQPVITPTLTVKMRDNNVYVALGKHFTIELTPSYLSQIRKLLHRLQN